MEPVPLGGSDNEEVTNAALQRVMRLTPNLPELYPLEAADVDAIDMPVGQGVSLAIWCQNGPSFGVLLDPDQARDLLQRIQAALETNSAAKSAP